MIKNISKIKFSTLKTPCLVRDFIYDRLYHQNHGYFCQPAVQIGELHTHIDFKSMIGYDDYKLFVAKNYPQNAWLTPSELFRPWYGFTLANYLLRAIKTMRLDPLKQRIKIVEVGAGTGSALDSILIFLKNYEQSLYNLLEYHIVEISPQMCQRAKQKLSQTHNKLLERGNIRVWNEDFLNFKPSNPKDFTFLIFLEVLDNMPHDKVAYCEKSKDYSDQIMVELPANKEISTPVSDPLIAECLKYYRQYSRGKIPEKKGFLEKLLRTGFFVPNKPAKNVFLPTFCLKSLKFVRDTFPNHHLIISDFDGLPLVSTDRSTVNSPIVSTKLKDSHEKKDYSSYLEAKGDADIFFPTNFELLKTMYLEVCGKKSLAMKSHEFVSEFAKEKWAETRSGYNPLKEDFLNTSFFLTQI